MAFERHGAALLLKMIDDGVSLGRVLTLGRQTTLLNSRDYRALMARVGVDSVPPMPTFADDVLLAMGGTEVVSMDFSAYEGATLLHDLNDPIGEELRESFDLVFEGGTLEHVFEFPVAIASCMRLLRQGGRLVAVTPANSWCGHGFYQFSPELFFRLLGPDNGFSVVEMYVALSDGRCYRVSDPEALRERVELRGRHPALLLVHARRDEVREVLAQQTFQSDYSSLWNGNVYSVSADAKLPAWARHESLRRLLEKAPAQVMLRAFLQRYRDRRWASLSNRLVYRKVNLKI